MAHSEHRPNRSPEYLAWKRQLAETVKDIDASGNFASHKTYTQFANPGLEVSDVSIPLPLPALYADQLKAAAQPAPFGRGDETVVDYSVRLTWELNSNQFRVTNPAWAGFLDTLVRDASNDLGLSPKEVRVEPYKLLLYEKGSFFKPHTDSEKTPGMIGTLVVCLPAIHEGGDVHLSHMGRKFTFATAPTSSFDLTALAWYSDVTHEVKEVTAGHRLVLTYNIVQTKGPGKSADFFIQRQTQLRDLITRWPRDFPGIARLVLFTDHKYTPMSLSASNSLKGRDRAVFESLHGLCADTGFYLFVANVTKTARDDDYASDYGDFDDDEFGISLGNLGTPEGTLISKRVSILEEDILGPDPYKGRKPDKTEEGEFTGNESQPDMYRYFNSAIVLVPRDKLHDLLPVSNPLNLLTIVVKALKENPGRAEVRDHAVKFMDKVIDTWFTSNRHSGSGILNTMRSIVLLAAYSYSTEPSGLRRKAVRSYTMGGQVPDELIEHLIGLRLRAPASTRSNWELWFGEVVNAPVSVTSLFAAMVKFEEKLEQADDKQSFRAWAEPFKCKKLEAKPSLTLDDYEGILELATSMWDNQVNWVSTKLLPKLKHGSAKALTGKVVAALAEKGRANALPGAEDVAKELLSSQVPHLRLVPGEFMSWHEMTSMNEGSRFLLLIETCVKHNWVDMASNLLQLGYADLTRFDNDAARRLASSGTVRQQPDSRPLICVSCMFVGELCAMLDEFRAPFIQPAQKLVEYILRNYILGPPPVLPVKPEGWAYAPRACPPRPRHSNHARRGPCEICPEFNRFLMDPERQTGEFCDTQPNRKHVEKNLPDHLFSCTTDPNGRDGRRSQTLIVTKRVMAGEYPPKLAEYQRKLSSHEAATMQFCHEKYRKVLGDELYQEIIMLEHLPRPQAVASAAGVKREADDDTVLPPAARPRYPEHFIA